jgi:orotate phosphoribosyltransferase-like protein
LVLGHYIFSKVYRLWRIIVIIKFIFHKKIEVSDWIRGRITLSLPRATIIENDFDEMLKVVSPHVKMGHVNTLLAGHFGSWFESEDDKDCKPVFE